MKAIRWVALAISGILLPSSAFAVTKAEDIATTIMLRGYACGGRTVSNITETADKAGNKTVIATCPNGRRYQVNVSRDGRVVVTLIQQRPLR